VNRIAVRIATFLLAALAVMVLLGRLTAQEPGTVPETKAPPAAPVVIPPPGPHYDPKVDWPWLGRFRDDDALRGEPATGENRVVFMGDSITQGWKIEGPDGYFPGKPYINRGISGQTTPQMLLRFRQDVINLHPRVVVILAGINDIAGNTGLETAEQIEGNLATMAELATAHHIRVVLCSIMPAFDFPWRPGLVPAPKVLAINAWIRSYAAEHDAVYVDYHTAMKDERDGLPATLSKDGVHPLPAGYAIMAPLVEAGIAKALKTGNRE
jgi:lysophospholipase L1-like esterase